MIKINNITPFVCEAFFPDDQSLGFLNDFEFNDLRIQIMKEGAVEYYMRYKGETIFIDKDGRAASWPKGFYDLFENQLMELC